MSMFVLVWLAGEAGGAMQSAALRDVAMYLPYGGGTPGATA